jgi:3-oxoacyl-[acyl-carrier-protein] synthase-3
MNIKILGMAKQLPRTVVSSRDLDDRTGQPYGSIEKSTGVSSRHWVADDETVTSLGSAAFMRALGQASLDLREIDLLITAGAAFDMAVPHGSVLLKAALPDLEPDFPCFHVHSTCLSFLNALDVAHAMLESGRHCTIAIVCAEISSPMLTHTDPKTYGLFGDAGVAMIIQRSDVGGYVCRGSRFENYPAGAELARLRIGGRSNRGRTSDPDDRGYFFEMESHAIIRATLDPLEPFLQKLQSQTGCSIHEMDAAVCHQTSKFGNTYMQRRYGLNEEQFIDTLHDHGNCISASIPLGLEKLYSSGPLEGKRVMLLGSGAGVSLGGMVLEFSH